MQKNIKKVIFSTFSIAAACTGLIGLTGCHNEESTLKQVVTCSPQKGSASDLTIELVLGKDGKTIEQATARKYTSVDLLKTQDLGYSYFRLGDGSEHDLEKDSKDFYNALFDHKTDVYEIIYRKFTNRNKNISWISYSLKENTTNKKAEFMISFDFTDKNFKLTDKTKEYLREAIPFDQLYNEKKDRLEYNAEKLDGLFKSIKTNTSCSESEKPLSETYHNKTVINLQEIRGQK